MYTFFGLFSMKVWIVIVFIFLFQRIGNNRRTNGNITIGAKFEHGVVFIPSLTISRLMGIVEYKPQLQEQDAKKDKEGWMVTSIYNRIIRFNTHISIFLVKPLFDQQSFWLLLPSRATMTAMFTYSLIFEFWMPTFAIVAMFCWSDGYTVV